MDVKIHVKEVVQPGVPEVVLLHVHWIVLEDVENLVLVHAPMYVPLLFTKQW